MLKFYDMEFSLRYDIAVCVLEPVKWGEEKVTMPLTK